MRRVGLVVFVVILVYAGVVSWRLQQAQGRELKERAARQARTLEAANWQRAAEASQRELASTVPALKEELEAVRKAKATTAIASHWEGKGAEISVPCTVVMGSPAGNVAPPPGSPATASSSETPPTVAVTPHVLIDDAVAIDDAGGVYVARKVQARLSVGEAWASAWEEIPPDPGSTTKVSPDIVAAVKAFKNPPYRFEAFVGASLGADGAGIFGEIAGGKGRLGWFAAVDYVLSDAARSRVSGGGRFSLKK